jgi:hypothetical protein
MMRWRSGKLITATTVTPDVWEAAGLAGLSTTYACLGCLEQRLGRTLRPADFPSFDVNDVSDLSSPRLKARLGDQSANSA